MENIILNYEHSVLIGSFFFLFIFVCQVRRLWRSRNVTNNFYPLLSMSTSPFPMHLLPFPLLQPGGFVQIASVRLFPLLIFKLRVLSIYHTKKTLFSFIITSTTIPITLKMRDFRSPWIVTLLVA